MSDNRGVQVKNCGFCKKCHTPFPISYKKTFGGYCVFCAEKRIKEQYGMLIGSTIALWVLTIACIVVSLYFGKIADAVESGGAIQDILMFVYMLLIAAAINLAPLAALVLLSRKVYMREVGMKTNGKVAVFSYWGLIVTYVILQAWSMSNMTAVYISVSVVVPLIVTILVYLDVAHLRKMLRHFRKATAKLEAELEKQPAPDVIPDSPYVS